MTTLPPSCAVVTKSGSLNFLEPSGPLQACNGTDLPFCFTLLTESYDFLKSIRSSWQCFFFYYWSHPDMQRLQILKDKTSTHQTHHLFYGGYIFRHFMGSSSGLLWNKVNDCCLLECHLSVNLWTIWFWVFQWGRVHLYLWMFRCGKFVLLRTRYFDVANLLF